MKGKKIKVIYNFVVGIESGESQNFWKGELLTLIDRAIVPRGQGEILLPCSSPCSLAAWPQMPTQEWSVQKNRITEHPAFKIELRKEELLESTADREVKGL